MTSRSKNWPFCENCGGKRAPDAPRGICWKCRQAHPDLVEPAEWARISGATAVQAFADMTGNQALLHVQHRHSAKGLIYDVARWHDLDHEAREHDHEHGEPREAQDIPQGVSGASRATGDAVSSASDAPLERPGAVNPYEDQREAVWACSIMNPAWSDAHAIPDHDLYDSMPDY